MEGLGGNQNALYASKSSAAAKLKIISRNSGVGEKKVPQPKQAADSQTHFRFPEPIASLNTTRNQGFAGTSLAGNQSPRAFRINQTKKSIPFLASGLNATTQLGDLSLSNVVNNADTSLNVRKPVVGLSTQEKLQSLIPTSPGLGNYFAASARGSANKGLGNIGTSNYNGVLSSSKTSKILDTSDGMEDRYQSSLQKYLIMKPNKLGREISPPSRAVYAPSPNTTQNGPSMLSSLVNSPAETPEHTNERMQLQPRHKAEQVSPFMPELKSSVPARTLVKQPSAVGKETFLKTPLGMGASPVRVKIEIKPRLVDDSNAPARESKKEPADGKLSIGLKLASKRESSPKSPTYFARSGSYDTISATPVLMSPKDPSAVPAVPTLLEFMAPKPTADVPKVITQPQTVKLESGSLGKSSPREESTLPSPSRAHRFLIKWTASAWPKIEEEIRVDKLLGQGSFAKVYQGFDLVRKIIVAIKVLDKRKISEMGFNKMAEKELEILQLVKHPHIGNFERMLEDKNRVGELLTDRCTF